NMLRLLDLPPDVQELVSRGTISMGHARALLGLADPESQRLLARRIESERLSVREAERLAKAPPAASGDEAPAVVNPLLEDLERQLAERLATRVTIRDRGGRGKLVIDYYSAADLGRLVEEIAHSPSAAERNAPAA